MNVCLAGLPTLRKFNKKIISLCANYALTKSVKKKFCAFLVKQEKILFDGGTEWAASELPIYQKQII